jgi:hypothetical protein
MGAGHMGGVLCSRTRRARPDRPERPTAGHLGSHHGREPCSGGTGSKPVESRRIVHQDLVADRRIRCPHRELV